MDAELTAGSRLGRYELLVELGRGGMASVWVAREPSDIGDRLIALKAMLPELARQSSDFRSMFLEEGQIVRSIDHPNVVKVHEVGEHHGVLFMAMEWIQGDSLRAIIREAKKRRPVPPEMAVRVIADTAAGLHAAHELRGWDGELRNLVHCDVSPHNILVGIDGRARLVDFGVANGTLYGDLQGDDKIKGKFGYMSPEQAKGLKIDRRSDVFSLGVVLFELTTGERLFRAESPQQTLRLVTSSRVPHPTRLVADYPPALADIVLRALDRDVNARYQTAEELREALEAFLIAERTLVSHASVGKLVGKVLGPRLEQQREALREALVAADGMVQAGLIPKGRESSGVGGEHRLSDPATGSHPTSTQGPFQHTLDPTPLPRRAPVFAVGFGALGVIAAVAAVIWASTQGQPNALVTGPRGAEAAQNSNNPTPARADETPPRAGESVSLDSIPLAERARAEAAARNAPPQAGPPRPASTHVRSAKVTLDEETATPPSSKQEAPAAEAVSLEETPDAPKAEAPAGPRGPLNRGAAMAALGAASGRVGACKSSGGPSGPGRAMVTFSPDGPVSSVSVPPPFSGTSVGTCVVTVFRSARVPAFTGSPVTLPQSFRIPE
jgi:serine/threonine protein kinase